MKVRIWLLGGLAMGADRAGLVLGDAQVYDFTPPPALGGSYEVANLSIMDFVVAVNIAGQLTIRFGIWLQE